MTHETPTATPAPSSRCVGASATLVVALLAAGLGVGASTIWCHRCETAPDT